MTAEKLALTQQCVRLIALDLDRTLLTSQKTVSDYALQTLGECQKRGIVIAFSTGRSYTTSLDCARLVKPDARVLSNGAVVYVGDEVIERQVIETGRANELLASIKRVPTLRELYVETETHLYGNSREELRLPQFTYAHYSDFSEPLDSPAVYICARLHSAKAAGRIEADFPDLSGVYFSDEMLYTYTKRGVGKWSGVRALLAHYGISASKVAYFGDDFSDLCAMKHCGISIAVANAIDPIKETAQFMTLSNDEDGVARWIDRHIL